ncbi:hypothetical protein N7465_011314 [Penicillium sp. CMV-2018d]|nr:hypothetical protein N7465_011314 [Penicillium sp. CMV-2018d]
MSETSEEAMETSSEEAMEISEPSIEHFATSTLPLFHGPLVKIHIQPSNREYTISKNLLCGESPVFSAMFEGSFRESQEQTATLQEMEGVISVQSIEALLQWLYLRTIKFDLENPGEQLSAAIELARLADKYEITGIENQTAKYIKDTILHNQHPIVDDGTMLDIINRNTYWLEAGDIISGILLHYGHPVRRALASASVGGFLQGKEYKFAGITQEYPKFGADLLHEVGLALNTLNESHRAIFKDPIGWRGSYLGRDWP